MLFLLKVGGWSAASFNLTVHRKWWKLSKLQNKAQFQVALVCFSHVSWKLEYFQIFSFHRRCFTISTFTLQQFQLNPKSHLSLTLSLSEHLSTCKEGKAVILANFQPINKYHNPIQQKDLQWQVVKWKCMETFFFCFIFHSILFSVKLQLLRRFTWFFFTFLAACLCVQNHCDPVISPGGIQITS